MNPDKKIILDQLLAQVNASPFLLVVDYHGLTVSQFSELRKRLRATGALCYVTKNAYTKKVIDEVGLPEELKAELKGQTAIVTGESDVCAAAKALKTFADEFKKPETLCGALDGKFLSPDEVKGLAALPPKEVLLAKLLGTLQAPASQLVRTLNEPGASLARVLAALEAKGGN
ncbi:MAG: 50S ribosomal protein L10 [Verrucomicrobiales bacterium]